MARLKITIEGEMSPEEMKRYIMAAWGNLPRDVAISEVDESTPGDGLSELLHAAPQPTAPEPVPVVEEAPAPPPPPPAPAGEADPQSEGFVAELCKIKKLCDVLAEIRHRTTIKELPEVIELCRSLQMRVPILERLGAGLEDRVTRTWEGMK